MSSAWLPTLGVMIGLGADDALSRPQVNTWPAMEIGLHHAPNTHGPRLGVVGRAALNLDNTGIFYECRGCDALRVQPDRVAGARLQLALPMQLELGKATGRGPRHVDLQLGLGADHVFSNAPLRHLDHEPRHAWWTPTVHLGVAGRGPLSPQVGVEMNRIPADLRAAHTAALSSEIPGWTRVSAGLVWRPTAAKRPTPSAAN